MARKKRPPAQIKIRLPEKLRRTLEREAAKNDRTLNGEIVYRLTEPIAVMETTERAASAILDRVSEQLEQISRRIDKARRESDDYMAQKGETELFGTPLTEINAKLDKLIALAEEQQKGAGQTMKRAGFYLPLKPTDSQDDGESK
jgi:hypothetical protein